MRDAFAWSFPIGYLFGITVRVHFFVPILMIGLVWRYAVDDKKYVPGTWVDVAAILGLMFLSVLLHELGHCFAARRVDGEADEVLLWPLGGLARCDVPHTPWANFITALGGPLVNFGLCIIAGLALGLLCEPGYRPPWNPFDVPTRIEANGAIKLITWSTVEELRVADWVPLLLARLFWVNWFLFLLNVCLVGIPFDGGRMLQCALWPYLGYKQALL
jgi:stage IV sporulation protein FB